MKQSGEKLKMMNVAAESVDKPKKVSSRASFEGVERTEEKTSKLVIDDRSNDKNSDTEYYEINEALTMIPLGRFHYLLVLMCGLAFMADAMEVGLLSFVSECAGAEWNLTNEEIATITSSVFIGELFGGMLFGPLADNYGRKLAFLIACILIAVAGVASGAAPNFTALVVLRAIVGIGVGGLTVPFDLLAEFSPKEVRGRFLLTIEYFWTAGSVFVVGMAWAVLGSDGWRTLTYITAIPVIISCIISVRYLPESPLWLMEKGRVEDAEIVLRNASEFNGTPLPSDFKLIASTHSSEIEDVPAHLLLGELVGPRYRRRIFPLWGVWISFGLAYYGIILFVTRVYQDNDDNTDEDDGPTCDFDYQDIFINSIMEVVGIFIATVTIDRFGRIITQFSGYILACVGVLFMGIGNSTGVVMTFGLFARAGIMWASCATWVMTPELFGTDVRATAHSSSNVIARIGALASPYIVDSDLDIPVIGIILSICCGIAAFAVIMLPETNQINLDEAGNGDAEDDSDSGHLNENTPFSNPIRDLFGTFLGGPTLSMRSDGGQKSGRIKSNRSRSGSGDDGNLVAGMMSSSS